MEDIHCWEEKFEVCQYSERLLNLLSQLNSESNSPVEILKVKQAIYYARKYHGSQMRKSGEP
jgi:(p)ppGpp synthase/HD superfamily hydrolase